MSEINTALVVDGDFLMRGYVVEVLQQEGVAVLEADTREAALRHLDDGRLDVVFADLNIIATLDKGRIRPGMPGVCPDWVITASFNAVDRAVDYLRRGACDYLLKPFSPAQVSVALSRIRESRQLKCQLNELERQAVGTAALSCTANAFSDADPYGTTNLQEIERQTIIRVFQETGGCRGLMADMLGISVRTLRNKLNQYRQEDALFQYS